MEGEIGKLLSLSFSFIPDNSLFPAMCSFWRPRRSSLTTTTSWSPSRCSRPWWGTRSQCWGWASRRTAASQTRPTSGVFHSTTTRRSTLLRVSAWWWTIEIEQLFHREFTMTISDHHLQNKSLPWDYDFRFVIEEISSIDDKKQVGKNNFGKDHPVLPKNL